MVVEERGRVFAMCLAMRLSAQARPIRGRAGTMRRRAALKANSNDLDVDAAPFARCATPSHVSRAVQQSRNVSTIKMGSHVSDAGQPDAASCVPTLRQEHLR
jgi:hypothetical protein